MNYHFTTSKAHVTRLGGHVEELVKDEGLITKSNLPFKGNIDLDKVKACIEKEGAENIASVEMVRLAFPRRVFTLSQTEYVIDRVKWLYDHRELIVGLRFVHEPKTLRFFTGKLEPVSDWPERLVEAYIAEFGEDQ